MIYHINLLTDCEKLNLRKTFSETFITAARHLILIVIYNDTHRYFKLVFFVLGSKRPPAFNFSLLENRNHRTAFGLLAIIDKVERALVR